MDTSTQHVVGADTGVRRVVTRRHRTIDERRAVVAETLEPGVSAAEVSRRHGGNANLIFNWRPLQQQGVRGARVPRATDRGLIPVTVVSECGSVGPASAGMLRVDFPGGIQLHINGSAEAALLERVVELLRR